MLVDRRLLLAGLGATTVATPASASPAQPWLDYELRLRARLGDAGGGVFQPQVEDDLLTLTNRYRQSTRRAPLTGDLELATVARAHVASMANDNYFDHVTPDGFRSVDRTGLLARSFLGFFGENLALHRSIGRRPWTAEEVLANWRGSPTHRENVIRTTFTHVGHGVVQARGRWYAAAVYGGLAVRLRQPMPLGIEAALIGQTLWGASPLLSAYTVSEPHANPPYDTFGVRGRPKRVGPGVWRVWPMLWAPDRSYQVLWGPIVVV
jgi:uncharacterized protein YkwD